MKILSSFSLMRKRWKGVWSKNFSGKVFMTNQQDVKKNPHNTFFFFTCKQTRTASGGDATGCANMRLSW